MRNLRDDQGKLLARYDPARRLLVIQRRGIKHKFNLAALDAAAEQSAQSAIAGPVDRAGLAHHDAGDAPTHS